MRPTPETTEKMREAMRVTAREMFKTTALSFLIVVASVFPILLLTAYVGLLGTLFPTLAGFATVLLVQLRFVSPRHKASLKKLSEEIKRLSKER